MEDEDDDEDAEMADHETRGLFCRAFPDLAGKQGTPRFPNRPGTGNWGPDSAGRGFPGLVQSPKFWVPD